MTYQATKDPAMKTRDAAELLMMLYNILSRQHLLTTRNMELLPIRVIQQRSKESQHFHDHFPWQLLLLADQIQKLIDLTDSG
jgi:hypothetical protein